MRTTLHTILLTTILGLLSGPFVWATHIIGGEVNYKCLGDNKYEITLQLFRDCDTGIPWFEDPAVIELLDFNGHKIDTINMNLRNNDTLSFVSSPCSVIPPSACIHTTIYREVRHLPFRAGGYQFLYQICCRNQDIVNIVNPTGTQAAYHAFMSEEALLSCNNGAKFKEWPPFYICNGQPLNLDHSAIDIDGDSIVYELYAPFDIYGIPARLTVTWNIPYSVSNMLGGPNALFIDPVTGLLTGTPVNNGTYVVGICAKEYRNGQLISTIRRDFQFIVTPCVTSIVADFEIDTLPCNKSLDLSFVNKSNPIHGPFSWDFGDGGPISDVKHPTHAFPDTGQYTVMLIAGLGSPCADTMIQQVPIYIKGADIEVLVPPVVCHDDRILLVAYNVFREFNQIVQYNWSPSGNIISGQGTDSVWFAIQGGNLGVWVEAINNYGCKEIIQLTQLNIPSDTTIARFDSLTFDCNESLMVSFTNQSVASNNQYFWYFDTLASSNVRQPTYTFPDTGWYTIRLIAGLGSPCQDTFDRELYIPRNAISLTAIDAQVVCQNDTILLTAQLDENNIHPANSFAWTPNDNIISGQGTDSIWVLANQNLDFRVVATNAKQCKDTADASINVSSISPRLLVYASPNQIYLGQTVDLLATQSPDYTYWWQEDSSLTANNIYNPQASPRESTTYIVQVKNSWGCTLTDSVRVEILPPLCANPVVFVPSAFSPDGDGHNDVLMVNGNNITELKFAIYNRWGQKLFETQDQTMGWDGSFKGKKLAPDVYGYYLQCVCDDGSQALLKGNITLLR